MENMEHLSKRSKSDLIEMIRRLVSERPDLIAQITSTEQRKAAGRVLAIQTLNRALGRAYRRLAVKHADVQDLLGKMTPDEQKAWKESRKGARGDVA